MIDPKFSGSKENVNEADKRDGICLDELFVSFCIALFASLACALLFMVDYPNPESISVQEGLKQTGFAFLKYFIGVMLFCLFYFYAIRVVPKIFKNRFSRKN